jgi:hypothetical protein
MRPGVWLIMPIIVLFILLFGYFVNRARPSGLTQGAPPAPSNFANTCTIDAGLHWTRCASEAGLPSTSWPASSGSLGRLQHTSWRGCSPMGLPRRSACSPANDGPALSTVSPCKPTAHSIRNTRLWRSTCSMRWPAPARRRSIGFCAGSATAGSRGINRLSSSCVDPPAWSGRRRSWRRAASCPRSSKPAGRTCCAITIVRSYGFARRIMKRRTWSSVGSKLWSARRCDERVASVWAIRLANTALLRRRRDPLGSRLVSELVNCEKS